MPGAGGSQLGRREPEAAAGRARTRCRPRGHLSLIPTHGLNATEGERSLLHICGEQAEVKGLWGWFHRLDSWGCVVKTHPGHISLLPSPPAAPSALQAGFPILGLFPPPFSPGRDMLRATPWQHPFPGWHKDPVSPLEQPRGRAPRAGARCRSALSRGRAPPRSFCSVSSTSLTELTSRAMLAWLSESSCGRRGHRGR